MSTKYYLQKVPVEAVQPGFRWLPPHTMATIVFQCRLHANASEVASR